MTRKLHINGGWCIADMGEGERSYAILAAPLTIGRCIETGAAYPANNTAAHTHTRTGHICAERGPSDVTVFHEWAHILAGHNGSIGHDYVWRGWMRALGQPIPDECENPVVRLWRRFRRRRTKRLEPAESISPAADKADRPAESEGQ